jgi:hypothetical protein
VRTHFSFESLYRFLHFINNNSKDTHYH